MKKGRIILLVFCLIVLSNPLFGTASAQDSLVALKATQVYADYMGDLRSTFTLPWSVISTGGTGGSADGYTIHSTLGQPVAGSLDGGAYHLTSGFWTEVIESFEDFFNYLPLILK